MTRPIFIFICSLLLIIPLLSAFGSVSFNVQAALCLPAILLLGLPHGALDQVLFLESRPKTSSVVFISIYLSVMLFCYAGWYFFPQVAYLAFLLSSAFHFGQAQFSHYSVDLPRKFMFALNILWGTTLLLALIYFNLEELDSFSQTDKNFTILQGVNDFFSSEILLVAMIASTTVFLITLYAFKKLTIAQLGMEVLVFILILASFYLLPFLIGFTLFFIILHSIKVLREQYLYFKSLRLKISTGKFIKMLSPLSVASFFGIAFLYFLSSSSYIDISISYIMLVLISCITVPHMVVMDIFYSYAYKFINLKQL